MKRILFFLIPFLALILAACSVTTVKTIPAPVSANANSNASQSAAVKAGSLERSDEQGAVTVTVTPTNLSSPGETFDFDVSLQTHMVDLSMDIAALSTLQTDTGVTIKATAWNGPKGGHHVKGKLSFPVSQDGKPILQGTKTLTLTIKDVDAAQRTFTWDVPR